MENFVEDHFRNEIENNLEITAVKAAELCQRMLGEGISSTVNAVRNKAMRMRKAYREGNM